MKIAAIGKSMPIREFNLEFLTWKSLSFGLIVRDDSWFYASACKRLNV